MTAPGTVTPEPVTPEPATDEPATPSTTARTLRRLRAALVAGSLLTGALCLLVSSQAHTGTDAAGGRAAPALLRAEAANSALADAHRVAVHGFLQGTVGLGGLGDQYQNDIAAISQNLAELARYNVAGPESTSDLQLVEGLVVAYNAEIEQAAADYQRTHDINRALPALWYATLQYREISATLDRLRTDGRTALTDRRSSAWLAGTTELLFLLPFALVLALFARTQFVLRRRFRRRLSIWLTTAALALTAAVLWCGQSLGASEGHLRSALDGPFGEAVTLTQQQASRSAAKAGEDLFAIVTDEKACPDAPRYCGTGLTPPAPATGGTSEDGHQLGRAEAEFTNGVGKADASSTERLTVVLLLTLTAAGAAARALNPRIDEYRYGGR
ncbi:hypothetical protein ACFYS8_30520 [Kitasatospora sp. NPDC004615]|uniref:hypothetical protein n=1 Tax=Kitasatospora sp. NPDC004615 TaxID=3364017 RepID=UPI0036956B2D